MRFISATLTSSMTCCGPPTCIRLTMLFSCPCAARGDAPACSGVLGAGALAKFDVEAWLTQGRFCALVEEGLGDRENGIHLHETRYLAGQHDGALRREYLWFLARHNLMNFCFQAIDIMRDFDVDGVLETARLTAERYVRGPKCRAQHVKVSRGQQANVGDTRIAHRNLTRSPR